MSAPDPVALQLFIELFGPHLGVISGSLSRLFLAAESATLHILFLPKHWLLVTFLRFPIILLVEILGLLRQRLVTT